jgi:predicted AAA+ superfamily ATPase
MSVDWEKHAAAVWRSHKHKLRAVKAIDPITLDTLVGIDRQKAELVENTERFLAGRPANHTLLWGARGTGKSSLIKAVLNAYKGQGLRLIEVFKQDLLNLPEIADDIRELSQRFIVYCDDFSFEANEHAYVGLKTILEGSIEQPPENVLLYVTSNRRHLVQEYREDDLETRVVDGELHYSDTVEEKISLSDRFGLWLSFYQPNLEGYLQIVDSYFPDYPGDRQTLHEAARLFSMTRGGSRSGRTAKQFYNHYAGKA